MLRRITRIICAHCGRARVTTPAGWHWCTPGADPAQAAGVAAVSLAMLVIVIAALTWALVHFWP